MSPKDLPDVRSDYGYILFRIDAPPRQTFKIVAFAEGQHDLFEAEMRDVYLRQTAGEYYFVLPARRTQAPQTET